MDKHFLQKVVKVFSIVVSLISISVHYGKENTKNRPPTHRRRITEGSYGDMAGYQCIGYFMRRYVYLTDFQAICIDCKEGT